MIPFQAEVPQFPSGSVLLTPIDIMIGIVLIMSGYAILAFFLVIHRGLPMHLAFNSKKVFQIAALSNGQAKIRGVKHSSLGADRIKKIGEWVHTPRSTIRVDRFSFQLGHTRFGLTIPLSAGELADVLVREGLDNMPIYRFEDLNIVRKLVEKVNNSEVIKKDSKEWKRYSELCNQMKKAVHLKNMTKEDKNDGKEEKEYKKTLSTAIEKFDDPARRSELTDDERTALYQAQLSTLTFHAIDIVRIGTFFENTFDTEPALVQHDRVIEEAREQSGAQENFTKLAFLMMVGIIAAGIVAAVMMRVF